MKKEPKFNDFLVKKDIFTGEMITEPVPEGTFKTYKARTISLRRGVAYAGYEQFYDISKKVYNVRNLSGDNLITFRPIHSQELKTSLANAHESDPYMKRTTSFYTDYTFGDEIKTRLIPLQSDTPKTREESDELVRKIITKKEHEGFMRFISAVDHMSNIHSELKKIWHQSYIFGMAAGWKTLSLRELVSIKKGREIRIPLGTPIKIKPIDGFHLTYVHQDVDTFDPKYYQYNNANATLTFVKNAKNEDVMELSLRPNSKLIEQYNMLPAERLLLVKRPNIGTTPNTSVYGVSPLLPILYISENIRRIDEKILPELNEGSYAGVGIFSVMEDSKYDIDKLAQDLSTAGTRIVMNEEIKYTPIEVDFNMDAIVNQKISLIKSELLALGLPEAMFFPTNTNRSVLEILINIWQNVDLQKERDLLNEVMWEYWYKDLMTAYFPDDELLDLHLTVKLEFKNKTFSGFIDKAAPTIAAYEKGIINKMEARENLDQDPFSEYEEEEIPAVDIAKRSQPPKPTTPVSRPTGVTSTVSTTVRDKVASGKKVSQSTSRSSGGTE